MKPFLFLPAFAVLFLFTGIRSSGQIQVTPSNNAMALAQKIAGEGITISNATFTGNAQSQGFFKNISGTQVGIDSGVILTCGRVKSASNPVFGIDGDGINQAKDVLANNSNGLPGDADIAAAVGMDFSDTHDACILEFDFVPIGDTIRFNYVFSSEEYTPSFVCDFNDAFAFFISGPGITGLKNIALVPGTNIPVTIFNVNNVQSPPLALCPNNIAYYINNESNRFFTHDGHTTVLTAVSEVQPCQTYHLKMVIVDVLDFNYDSGVFLEAGSLRSDPLRIDGHNPVNEFNLPYLAEGCVPGAIHVVRSRKKPYAQQLNLTYAGTAVNGVDVQLLPTVATIPANDSVVVIPIQAIADFIPEPNEKLKIYISNGCATIFSDSIEIEIRDVDMLAIEPADSIRICRNGSVQLDAVDGYVNYSWTNGATLSNSQIDNPVATPNTGNTNYICTATIGNCTARDSVLVTWKMLSLVSKTDIPCRNGTTGAITVAGTGWEGAVSYSINNGPFQPGNSFTGLAAGTYWVKAKDASACIDSIQVTLVQSFPDIGITADITPAGCSLTPDGSIAVTATGGNGNYSYSVTGTSYQPGNVLTVPAGTFTVFVRDGNACTGTMSPVIVPKINTVTVDAGADVFMCEGTSHPLSGTSNATTVNWTPAATLANANTLTPTASPAVTTLYYITASFGTCTRTDSVMVNVWKAPVANAGDDQSICFGITAQLSGSGGVEYNWTPDPSFVSPADIADPVVKPGVTTNYFLHVTDIHGCRSLAQDVVKVNVTPSVKIFAGRDTIVALNQPLHLNAIELNNSGVTKWDWSPPVNVDNPFIPNPTAVFMAPVITSPFEYIYVVTGTTPEGCQGSDDIKIRVYAGPEIYLPSGFTPNHDGRNDQLIALPVGMKEFRYFRVFNRWGQMVFQTSDPTRGWDGSIRGAEQPTGVFIWTAGGVDYTGKIITRQGTTTLIR